MENRKGCKIKMIGKKSKYFFRRLAVLLMILSVFSPLQTYAASDITPPKLNKLIVTPQEVTTGETVKVIADVTDDLSGVFKVSMVYKSTASNTIKDVALLLNKENGTYEGSFKIESYDVLGEWKVESIYLRDLQDNYAYMYDVNNYKGPEYEYRDLSPYTLMVKGTQADITPPTLKYLSVTPKEVTTGNTVKISADVVDDLSGVEKVSITYKTPAGTYKNVPLWLNIESGKYDGSFEISPYDVTGEWKIDHIYLTDKQFNPYFIYPLKDGKEGSGLNYEYRDLTPYTITVKGTQYDKTPPALGSLSITPKEVSLGDIVKVSAVVTDDVSGVEHVSYIYITPDSKKHVQLFLNDKTGMYEGSFEINKYDAPGDWKISQIYLRDNQQNNYYIYDSNGGKEYKGPEFEYRDLSEYALKVVQAEADQAPPTTTIKLVPSNGQFGEWYSSNVTVTLNSMDDKSGVGKTIYRINGGDWYPYSNPFELKYDGKFMIEYLSIDKSGNEEKVKSEEVKIDTYAPITSTSVLPSSWTNKEVSVSLSAIDKASGVALLEYRINGGEFTAYKGPIVFSKEGRFDIDYRSVDFAGNVEVIKSFGVKNDFTAPKTSLKTVKNGWNKSDVSLILGAMDNLSGVAKTQYRVNDGDWFEYKNEIVLSKEGISTLEYRSIDYAGNIEEANEVDVKIDKSNPLLDFSFDQSIITDKNHKLIPIKVSVTAEDSLSGIASIELVSVASNQDDNGLRDGNTNQDIQGVEIGTADTEFLVRAETNGNQDRVYTVTYKAIDHAGNVVVVSKDIVVKANNSK
jgi:hypothetical protein